MTIKINTIDWKTKLAELLMIVAGILIASWLSNWNQNVNDRRAELQLLREMRVALAGDIDDNTTDYEFFKAGQDHLIQLDEAIKKGEPYSPRLDSLFGVLMGTRVLQANTGPYEVLRTRGFDLLTNDSLRSRIVHYYGTNVPFMNMRYARVDGFVQNFSAPYYFKHFTGVARGVTTAVPVSYEFVSHDPEFRNLVSWGLGDLDIMVTSYVISLQEGHQLLNSIDRHVRELE